MPLKYAQSDEYDDGLGSSLDQLPEAATIGRLMGQIDNDWSINIVEKLRLLSEIKRLTNNAPSWTPLGNVMYGGFAALFGNLIGKYFNMGTTARTIATLVGAGLGSSLYNRTHSTARGWNRIP